MPSLRTQSPSIVFAFLLGCCVALGGLACRATPNDRDKSDSLPVVVYVSVDRAFAEPLLARFAEQSGLDIKLVFDTEASKTTGLLNRLRAEKTRPRADVWWSSEIFGTIDLAADEIFAPYSPTTADDIPPSFKSPNDLWTAFGLRGRVLAFRKGSQDAGDKPRTWWDLTKPRYKGRLAIADPRFGTTRGHFAAMLALWGEQPFRSFLEKLKAQEVKRATGNSHAVILVRRDAVDWGATDTDDVIVAQARGDEIEMTYPTMALPTEFKRSDDGIAGAHDFPLWIPCSVALVKGARNPDGAKQLIDLICSDETEEALYRSESRNIPVRDELRVRLGIQASIAALDYTAVAARLQEARRIFDEIGPFR